jgi:aspartate kinase
LRLAAPASDNLAMQPLVQKYGGTSVASTDRIVAVARRIAAASDAGHPMVVVVSAMGDTTDELLQLAHRITPAPPARELDMLLTAGERISMALLSIALQSLGYPAISFTGSQSGIITDERHADAKILDVRGERIRAALETGRIVIVAGFQGVSSGREITTLGRGGSDTTAVALAAALGAERCEIYTDVDGVYSADPRAVPHATQIERIDYDEMLELAARGARVLHPRSVEVARHFGVRVHVRSSFTQNPGTVVEAMDRIESDVVRGIACDEDVATLVVAGLAGAWRRRASGDGARQPPASAPRSSCSRRPARKWCWLLQAGDADHAEVVLRPVLESLGAKLRLGRDVAMLSVVGHAIHSHPGTVGRILTALASADVPVQLVSSSAISVSCVVPRGEARRAMALLHARLGLEGPTKVHSA